MKIAYAIFGPCRRGIGYWISRTFLPLHCEW